MWADFKEKVNTPLKMTSKNSCFTRWRQPRAHFFKFLCISKTVLLILISLTFSWVKNKYLLKSRIGHNNFSSQVLCVFASPKNSNDILDNAVDYPEKMAVQWLGLTYHLPSCLGRLGVDSVFVDAFRQTMDKTPIVLRGRLTIFFIVEATFFFLGRRFTTCFLREDGLFKVNKIFEIQFFASGVKTFLIYKKH